MLVAIFTMVAVLAISGCKKKETYTVTFDANGGTGEMAEQIFTEGEPRALVGNLFSYQEHTFKCWNTMKNGTGTSYDDRQRITVTSDMTLFAQWKKIVTFVKVTFDANGGTGEMRPQQYVVGSPQVLRSNEFTSDTEGYVFVCWNTMPDGSGTSYLDGQIITVTSDITLYAQWKQMWVDLGLPSGTLWATCHVGAEAPEEFGDHFAWGETEPKDEFNWVTYRWCNGEASLNENELIMTKYNADDNLTALEAADDAATANWGEDWRMPTKAELSELIFYCTVTFTIYNGVRGNLFVGRNGNSIFLPAAGGYGQNEGEDYGLYWSSSLGTDFDDAWYIFTGGNCLAGCFRRCCGFSVRPVYQPHN